MSGSGSKTLRGASHQTVLLAALAVQFIIDGLHGSGFGMPFPGA